MYSIEVVCSRKQGKYDCWGNWIRQHKKTLSRVSGKRKKKYHAYGCVHRYIDSSDLGDAHLEEMKNALLDKKPTIVFSYSSTLVELAKYIDRSGIPKEGFSMKSVLTGGEGLSDENRNLLEKVFGSTVYRRYSDMELGILGQDMGNGSEYMLRESLIRLTFIRIFEINIIQPAVQSMKAHPQVAARPTPECIRFR